MFLVGSYSWLRGILYSSGMLYYKKADVLSAILQSSSEHTQEYKVSSCMFHQARTIAVGKNIQKEEHHLKIVLRTNGYP